MKKQISPYLIVLLIFSTLCATATADVLPPTLEIKWVSFPQVLYAGQTRILSINIKNTELADAHELTIELESDLESLSFAPSTEVPLIPKGSIETVKIPVAGKKDLSNNDEARIRIRLIDKGHNQEFPFDKPRIHKFKTRELELVLDQVKFQNVSRQNKSIQRNDVINLKFRVWNKSGVTAEKVGVKVENNQKGVIWLGAKIGEPLGAIENLLKERPAFAALKSNEHQVVNYIYHLNSDFNNNKVRFAINGTTRSGKGNWVKEEYEHPVIVPFNWLPIVGWVGGAAIVAIIIGVAIKKRWEIVPRWISEWLVFLGGTVFTIITIAIISIWLGIWKWVAVGVGSVIGWIMLQGAIEIKFGAGALILAIAGILILILMLMLCGYWWG